MEKRLDNVLQWETRSELQEGMVSKEHGRHLVKLKQITVQNNGNIWFVGRRKWGRPKKLDKSIRPQLFTFFSYLCQYGLMGVGFILWVIKACYHYLFCNFSCSSFCHWDHFNWLLCPFDFIVDTLFFLIVLSRSPGLSRIFIPWPSTKINQLTSFPRNLVPFTKKDI